jgi:hypothetical protein
MSDPGKGDLGHRRGETSCRDEVARGMRHVELGHYQGFQRSCANSWNAAQGTKMTPISANASRKRIAKAELPDEV